MPDCLFCRIASHEVEPVVVHEDEELMAFLDIGPIRPGHTQIIPKTHVATFELLPGPLAAQILDLGQQLARRMKEVFGVERVAFLFTGGDVAHAHAHVIPLHDKTDITSSRYIVGPPDVTWGSAHLMTDPATLRRVRDQLGFTVTVRRFGSL
jgi:histidine triad (HIT) family protein